MSKSNWKYLVLLLADLLFSAYAFWNYNNPNVPPIFAHHLIVQLFLTYFLITDVNTGRSTKTFLLWNTGLITAHLLGAFTGSVLNHHISALVESLPTIITSDLILIVAMFVIYFLFATKKDKDSDKKEPLVE